MPYRYPSTRQAQLEATEEAGTRGPGAAKPKKTAPPGPRKYTDAEIQARADKIAAEKPRTRK